MGTTNGDDRLAKMLAELKRQDDELARCQAIAEANENDAMTFVVEGLEERIGAYVEATSILRPAIPARAMRA
jgi:hypothetical protein